MNNVLIYFLIFSGSIVWFLTTIRNGLLYSFGMGFWEAHGHDGIWHIALAKQLAQGTFEMPIFAGERIKNYHIGFDLLLAWIHKLTGISIVNLYFQVLPILFALVIGLLTYKFVFIWRNSFSEAFWATFFVYFGGSFGWVLTLVRDGKIGGESVFWSQQAISTLVNPPFAFSLILLLFGLICIVGIQRGTNFRYLIIAILCFTVLLQVKVYGGLLSLGGLFILSIIQFVKERKSSFLLLFVPTAVLSWLLFFQLNRSASNLVFFYPFWFLEMMMLLPDRLNWVGFYEIMTYYRVKDLWIRVFITYGLAFLIFLVGNMGTRIISFLSLLEFRRNKIDYVFFFLLIIFIGGILFPMLFLQEGTPWNTVQFFYYSLFVASIWSGIAMNHLTRSWILVVFVLLLTLPTTYGVLCLYVSDVSTVKISQEELEALNFLDKLPGGRVLTYPYNPQMQQEGVKYSPQPLYIYRSTAYVAAFSGKPVFLEDEDNLTITNYDWKERKARIEEFFSTEDVEEAKLFLKDNKIAYIYLVGKQSLKFDEKQLGVKKIFENQEARIYRVE